jgi:hypothetical protein
MHCIVHSEKGECMVRMMQSILSILVVISVSFTWMGSPGAESGGDAQSR